MGFYHVYSVQMLEFLVIPMVVFSYPKKTSPIPNVGLAALGQRFSFGRLSAQRAEMAGDGRFWERREKI